MQTGETEQDALFQYRANEDLFVSDGECGESFRNVSSDKSSHDGEIFSRDHAINNSNFNEDLNSIPGFYDCNEKVACLFDTDRQILQQENEDLATKLNEITLNDESTKSPNLIEIYSEKLGFSPEIVNASNHRSSQETKRSLVQNSRSYYPELSDCCLQNLESSSHREEIPLTSPQASSSQHSSFSNHIASVETADWMPSKSTNPGTYSMIPSPISSKYINLTNALSSQAHQNSNASHTTDTHILEHNPSSISLNRLPNSPSTSFEIPSDIIRRNFSRYLEHQNASSDDIHCIQGCKGSNRCLCLKRNIRNTTEECNSLNSDFLAEKLFRSWEEPSTSTRDIFSTEKLQSSNAWIAFSNKNGKENASSLSNLTNTSTVSLQHTPPSFPQYRTYAPKSARKLLFESDSSSDDSKEKFPTQTGASVRKFCVKKESRKKRKTSDLSKPSKNQVNVPKTLNGEKVSENTYILPLSENYEEKSLKPEESKSIRSILGSSEIMNSEMITSLLIS